MPRLLRTPAAAFSSHGPYVVVIVCLTALLVRPCITSQVGAQQGALASTAGHLHDSSGPCRSSMTRSCCLRPSLEAPCM
jgi:hypothetical protein